MDHNKRALGLISKFLKHSSWCNVPAWWQSAAPWTLIRCEPALLIATTLPVALQEKFDFSCEPGKRFRLDVADSIRGIR